jgi:hypothetical protein
MSIPQEVTTEDRYFFINDLAPVVSRQTDFSYKHTVAYNYKVGYDFVSDQKACLLLHFMMGGDIDTEQGRKEALSTYGSPHAKEVAYKHCVPALLEQYPPLKSARLEWTLDPLHSCYWPWGNQTMNALRNIGVGGRTINIKRIPSGELPSLGGQKLSEIPMLPASSMCGPVLPTAACL